MKQSVLLLLGGAGILWSVARFGHLYGAQLQLAAMVLAAVLFLAGIEGLAKRPGAGRRFGLSLLAGLGMLGLYLWLSQTWVFWLAALRTAVETRALAGLRGFLGESVVMGALLPLLVLPVNWLLLLLLERYVYILGASLVLVALWYVPPLLGVGEAGILAQLRAELPYLRFSVLAYAGGNLAATLAQLAGGPAAPPARKPPPARDFGSGGTLRR